MKLVKSIFCAILLSGCASNTNIGELNDPVFDVLNEKVVNLAESLQSNKSNDSISIDSNCRFAPSSNWEKVLSEEFKYTMEYLADCEQRGSGGKPFEFKVTSSQHTRLQIFSFDNQRVEVLNYPDHRELYGDSFIVLSSSVESDGNSLSLVGSLSVTSPSKNKEGVFFTGDRSIDFFTLPKGYCVSKIFFDHSTDIQYYEGPNIVDGRRGDTPLWWKHEIPKTSLLDEVQLIGTASGKDFDDQSGAKDYGSRAKFYLKDFKFEIGYLKPKVVGCPHPKVELRKNRPILLP